MAIKTALRLLALTTLSATLLACSAQPWQPVPVEQRDNAQRTQQLEGLRAYRGKQQAAQQGVASPAPQPVSPVIVEPEVESSPAPEAEQVLAPEGLAANSTATNPAVKRLLQQAQQAGAQGYHQTALSYLQRALRISPNSAEVYLSMGQQQQALGQEQQACNLVQKARHYAIKGSRIYYEINALLSGC